MRLDVLADAAVDAQTHAAADLPEFFHILRASPDEVRQALRAAVARFARTISPDDAGALELVLAEVLNNVVEHAYGDDPDGPVVLHVVRGPGCLSCQVTDRGKGMPEGIIDRDFAPLDALGRPAEGGYGWPLIRSLTEGLTYVRRGPLNVLSFRVPLGIH